MLWLGVQQAGSSFTKADGQVKLMKRVITSSAPLPSEFQKAFSLAVGFPDDLKFPGRLEEISGQTCKSWSQASPKNHGRDCEKYRINEVKRGQGSQQCSASLADQSLHSEFPSEDFESRDQVDDRIRKEKELRLLCDPRAESHRHFLRGKNNQRRLLILEDFPRGVEFACVRNDDAERNGRESFHDALFSKILARESHAHRICRDRSPAGHDGVGSGPDFLKSAFVCGRSEERRGQFARTDLAVDRHSKVRYDERSVGGFFHNGLPDFFGKAEAFSSAIALATSGAQFRSAVWAIRVTQIVIRTVITSSIV